MMPVPGADEPRAFKSLLPPRWVWPSLVVSALLIGVLAGPQRGFHGGFGESKADVARLTVMKLANEAYPAWRRDHPGTICPTKISELDRYMDHPNHDDPWGAAYVFTCGGDGRLYVASFGMDRIANTADDVWSHQ